MSFKDCLEESATVQADIAVQPGRVGDTFKRDPLKNVKKDIKKIDTFKEWSIKKKKKKKSKEME